MQWLRHVREMSEFSILGMFEIKPASSVTTTSHQTAT